MPCNLGMVWWSLIPFICGALPYLIDTSWGKVQSTWCTKRHLPCPYVVLCRHLPDACVVMYRQHCHVASVNRSYVAGKYGDVQTVIISCRTAVVISAVATTYTVDDRVTGYSVRCKSQGESQGIRKLSCVWRLSFALDYLTLLSILVYWSIRF